MAQVTKKYKTGWLSPTGKLITCNGYAHVMKAQDIAKHLNIFNEQEQSDDTLIRNGWVRISRFTYDDCGLAFFMPRIITDSQRDFLKKLYFDGEQISNQGMDAFFAYHII